MYIERFLLLLASSNLVDLLSLQEKERERETLSSMPNI